VNYTCSPTGGHEDLGSNNFRVVGCESPPVLKCPTGTNISQGTVKYGRWDNTICPPVNSDTPAQFEEYPLYADALGKQTYQYPSIHSVHGDPYPNVPKHY